MRIANWSVSALCLCVLTFAGNADLGAEEPPPKKPVESTQWPWGVAILKSSSPDVETAASRLARTLKNRINVLKTEKNPGCCIWLDVGSWRPNPSEPGYLVIVQVGGAMVLASDVKQLDGAIRRLEKVRRVEKDKVFLPVGVLTNYTVVDAGE